MPTIDFVGPYRVFFTSHDMGEPPHVHVKRDRSAAKLWLDPVALARNGGFSARELTEIQRIVEQRQAQYLERWHEFFG